MKRLQTADDVIDALGGTSATSRLTGASIQAVSNWRATGRLPANTFIILSKALKRIDARASPSLWGIMERVA